MSGETLVVSVISRMSNEFEDSFKGVVGRYTRDSAWLQNAVCVARKSLGLDFSPCSISTDLSLCCEDTKQALRKDCEVFALMRPQRAEPVKQPSLAQTTYTPTRDADLKMLKQSSLVQAVLKNTPLLRMKSEEASEIDVQEPPSGYSSNQKADAAPSSANTPHQSIPSNSRIPSPATTSVPSTAKKSANPALAFSKSTSKIPTSGKAPPKDSRPNKISINLSRPSLLQVSAQPLIAVWNAKAAPTGGVARPVLPPRVAPIAAKKGSVTSAVNTAANSFNGSGSGSSTPEIDSRKWKVSRVHTDSEKENFEKLQKKLQDHRRESQMKHEEKKLAEATPDISSFEQQQIVEGADTFAPEPTPAKGYSSNTMSGEAPTPDVKTPISRIHTVSATPSTDTNLIPKSAGVVSLKAFREKIATNSKNNPKSTQVKDKLKEFREHKRAKEEAAKKAKQYQDQAQKEEQKRIAEKIVQQELIAQQQRRESYDNYEMSDNDDSEDEELVALSRSQKKIPDWAQGSILTTALETQFGVRRVDPDTIFPDGFETCDLKSIFCNMPPPSRKSQKRYSTRNSTGNWVEDRLTFVEKLTYRRDMGFKRDAPGLKLK